jgi:hypothetical protein
MTVSDTVSEPADVEGETEGADVDPDAGGAADEPDEVQAPSTRNASAAAMAVVRLIPECSHGEGQIGESVARPPRRLGGLAKLGPAET